MSSSTKPLVLLVVFLVIVIFYASAASLADSFAQFRFQREEQKNNQQDAQEAFFKLHAALDNLKRIGRCGDAALVESHVAALADTVTSDFVYNLTVHGYSVVMNKTEFLNFMYYIATSLSESQSQHHALNTIVTLNHDGKAAFLDGKMIEYGKFDQSENHNIPAQETSIETYQAVAVWEHRGHHEGHEDHGQWRISYYYEQGNIIFPFFYATYQRDFCPGAVNN